ncbi:MAG: cation:proton antiporter [Opitutaceae bacterium]|nr:cation:proton antiporter [Cytophagales bacterium]
MQIFSVMLIARLFGWLCKRVNQPPVIGEILAGIVLGPSLLGMWFPEFSAFLFPEKSISYLKLVSQVGLILFMFLIGMELDLSVLKNKMRNAIAISYVSILLPFALGFGLSYFIYERLAPEGIGFVEFSLFMGIAMSITAFPVLVRIVHEKGLQNTSAGIIAIACAAADDITAWCILAGIIAIAKGGSLNETLYLIFFISIYILVMLKVIQPLLNKLFNKYGDGRRNKSITAICFLVLLISSFTTEILGIHALFGAFLAGLIMPSNITFRKVFVGKIEDVSTILFLPLFFVLTGLRTQINLLDNFYLWGICGVVVLLAVTGKFLGSTFTARLVGINWKDSLIIGALMNTRGLMELIVLNIGYDLGIISKELFSIMVCMALITTVMTGPILDLINRKFKTV